MSSIKLKGSTSGEITISAPAVAGTNTLTLPATTGSLITSPVTGDFTVDTDTFHVDTTNKKVGINTTSPTDEFVVSDNGDGFSAIQIKVTNTTGNSELRFADSDSANPGVIYYVHSDDSMRFNTGGAEEMRLENDGDLHVDGDVIAFSTTVSDVALKSDIEMIPNALDKIDEVRGVTFTRHNGQKSAGIIAQELEKVLPEAVREKKLALHDGKEYKTVEYDAIHGLLISCIKELKEKVRKLENGIT